MTSIALSQEYPLTIPYQVDLSSIKCGRHISPTKRHVRCKFGLAHIPSILAGKNGVDCRGIEMDVHFIWSLTSGKQKIHFNDVLIYHNVASNRAVQKFEHSFIIPESVFPGCHIMKIIAWATSVGTPSNQPSFTLEFDGQNYNRFLKIYQLGGDKMMRSYGDALDSVVTNGKVALRTLPSASATDSGSGNTSQMDITHGRRRYIPRNDSINRQTQAHDKRIDQTGERAPVEGMGHKNLEQRRQIKGNRVPVLTNPQPLQQSKSFDAKPRLETMKEDVSLIDLHSGDPPIFRPNMRDLNPPQLFRSTSSITLDTNFDDDYDHLNPEQIWKTQQNVSFIMQKSPPVFADSLAGDLMSHNPGISLAGDNGAGGFSGYRNPQIGQPYMSPPPQQQQQQQHHHQQQQQQQHYQQQPTSSFQGPAFMQQPQQGSPILAPPAPTLESLNFAFAQPKSGSVTFPSAPPMSQQHPMMPGMSKSMPPQQHQVPVQMSHTTGDGYASTPKSNSQYPQNSPWVR